MSSMQGGIMRHFLKIDLASLIIMFCCNGCSMETRARISPAQQAKSSSAVSTSEGQNEGRSEGGAEAAKTEEGKKEETSAGTPDEKSVIIPTEVSEHILYVSKLQSPKERIKAPRAIADYLVAGWFRTRQGVY